MVETTELASESNVGYMKIKVTKVEWIFPLSDWMNTVVIYQDKESRVKCFVSNVLCWRCLLDIQVEMLSSQLSI